jgi:heme exporter protein D
VGKQRDHQAGFIREILWLALIVAVVAVVLLDGMALLNARKSAEESAREAAREARVAYSQTQDVDSAAGAASAYLAKAGKKLVAFDVKTDLDGSPVFVVSTEGHADTYVVRYLRYVGLEGWLEKVSNPGATETST